LKIEINAQIFELNSKTCGPVISPAPEVAPSNPGKMLP